MSHTRKGKTAKQRRIDEAKERRPAELSRRQHIQHSDVRPLTDEEEMILLQEMLAGYWSMLRMDTSIEP